MRWVYRLQQRLAITQRESNVLLSLTLLFALGLAARYVQSQQRPLPDDLYAEQDRAFAEASTRALPAAEPQPVAEVMSGEPEAAHAALTPTAKPDADAIPRMNLNTVSARQLEQLPRIGPKIAERIIAHREAHGPFRRVSDLVQVRGIGVKTLEKLEPYLFVEDAAK